MYKVLGIKKLSIWKHQTNNRDGYMPMLLITSWKATLALYLYMHILPNHILYNILNHILYNILYVSTFLSLVVVQPKKEKKRKKKNQSSVN